MKSLPVFAGIDVSKDRLDLALRPATRGLCRMTMRASSCWSSISRRSRRP